MMHDNKNSLRSPLAKARGLGSAKSGTEHWVMERLTALILIPTTFYVLIGFLNNAVAGGYQGAVSWLGSPLSATVSILFLLAGLRHLAAGLQVVMEDYIPRDGVRLPLLFIVKTGGAALAIAGVLSIAKIYLGV